jgi:hypothetical protein
MMKKLSKKWYLGWIIGAYVVGSVFLITGLIIGVVWAVIKQGKFTLADIGLLGPAIMFFLLGIASTVVAAIFCYVVLYKAWQVIQDGQPRTTPGKAVGFLFIPFFNLYWMFVAYWGWAKDCNAYISSRGLSLAPLPEKLYLAFPIITLCSGIPYVGSAAALAVIVVFIIMCNQMIDTINGIYDARMITTAAQV